MSESSNNVRSTNRKVSWAIVVTVALVGFCVLTILVVQSTFAEVKNSAIAETPADYFYLWQNFNTEHARLVMENIAGVKNLALARGTSGLSPLYKMETDDFGNMHRIETAPMCYIQGVQSSLFTIRNLTIAEGRFLDELDEGEYVTVIRSQVAKAHNLSVGSWFSHDQLDGHYRVIGILDEVVEDYSKYEGYSAVRDLMVNNKLFVPYDPKYRVIWRGPGGPDVTLPADHTALWVSVDEGWNVTEVGEAARAFLDELKGPDRRVLVYQGIPTQTIFTHVDETTSGSIGLLASLVIIVGLLNISALIVMHSFLNAKEIGIKRACGATQNHIVREYVIKYLRLSLIGTLVALPLTWLGAPLVAQYMGATVKWSYANIIAGVILTLAVGPLCSLLPAKLTSKTSPVDTIQDRVAWGQGRRRVDLSQLLTAIAFSSAIAVMCFVTFYGYSTIAQTNAYLRSAGRDLVTIAEPPLGSVTPIPRLSAEDYVDLQGLAQARESQAAWLTHTSTVVSTDQEDMQRVTLYGTEGDVLEVRGFKLKEGRWFNAEGEIVIGATVAQGLYGKSSPLGQALILQPNKEAYTIVGVLEGRPRGVADFDNDRNNSVYIPKESMATIANPNTIEQAIYWLSANENKMLEDITHIQGRLRHSNPQGDNLEVTQPLGPLQEVKQLLIAFHVSVVAIALLAIISACVGISSLTLVKTKQMEREIAIKRACGASKQVVFRDVLIIVIGVVVAAALIGLGGGYMLYLTVAYVKALPLVSMWAAIFAGALIAIMLAIISAYVPAKQATNRPPASIF